MRRGDLAAGVMYLLLAAGPAAWVLLGGWAWLPRHSAARDLPWTRTAAHGQVASGAPLNHDLSDAFNLVLPDRHLLHRSQVPPPPAWNDLILGGVPHQANPLTSAAYPPAWIFAAWDPMDGLLMEAALHVLLLGVFFHLFLRCAGLGPAGSAVGGMGLMLSGWVAAHAHNVPLVDTLAWVPLGLVALELRARGARVMPLLLLPLSLGLMWCAGFPQLAVYGSLALALYALPVLGEAARKRGIRALPREAGVLGGLALLGLALGALQLAPLLQALPHVGHQDMPESALQAGRLRAGAWWGLGAPRLLGDPMEPPSGGWQRDPAALLVLGEPTPDGIRPPRSMNWSERTLYPGVLVLLLALGALPRLRRRPVAALLLVGLVGGVAATLPAAISLLAGLPGFDVGQPSRALVLVCLALPGLAAFGADRLWERSQVRGRPTLSWMSLVMGVLLALPGVWAWAAPETALRQAGELLVASGAEERLGVAEPRPVAAYLPVLRGPMVRLRTDLLVMAAAFMACGGLLLLANRPPGPGRRLARGLLPLLVAAELLVFLVPANLPVPQRELFAVTPGIRYLQENLGGDRFMRTAPDAQEAVREADVLLVPNLGMVFGLRDAQGYRELVPRRYLELFRGTSALVLPVGLAGVPAERAGSPILDLARVRFLVASGRLEPLEPLRAYPPPGREKDAELWIYRNPDLLPHAFLVGRWRFLDAGPALEAVRSGAVDLREEAVLEESAFAGSEMPQGAAGGAPARLVKDAPGELEVVVEGPGLLVVTDTWMPGWEAVVEPEGGGPGNERPVLRADAAFLGVPVLHEGPARVRLRYRSAGGMLGSGLSAAALAVMLALGGIAATRRSAAARPGAPRPQKRDAEQTTGPPRAGEA